MDLEGIHKVYFIGIGGIGMSNLARYFRLQGKQVCGYDKTPSEITAGLEEIGVAVVFEDKVSLVPEEFLNSEDTLIVYTPAVPKYHAQLTYFKEHGFAVHKRAEVLGMITRDTFCLAVAGTHGKTTTSAILGHLLYEGGVEMTAFLGGIAENYNSNFISTGTGISVVEADEYDRSFLQLDPDVACITSMEADHLDIYGTEQGIIESFTQFAGKVKGGGKLFVRFGLPIQGFTYGLEEQADYHIKNITIENGTYCFDLVTPQQVYEGVRFNKPGKHNLLNALAAFAMAAETNAPANRLVSALETFTGVKRRFTYQVKNEELVFIDDYAHHPTEINALYQAVSEMFPGKHITAVFQPHLFSRTRDFAEGFATSLAQFDKVILLDIYPAREEPIEGVTSQWLLDKIAVTDKQVMAKEEVISYFTKVRPEVVVTIGAGDIGNEVEHIKKALLI